MSSVKEIKIQVHEKLVETGEYEKYDYILPSLELFS